MIQRRTDHRAEALGNRVAALRIRCKRVNLAWSAGQIGTRERARRLRTLDRKLGKLLERELLALRTLETAYAGVVA